MLLLSGCMEIYEDRTSFIPPKTKSERDCANDCIKRKDTCITECQRIASEVDIMGNVTSAIGGIFGSSNQGNTSNMKECVTRCEKSHMQCHQNCGGKVLKERVCVANCK